MFDGRQAVLEILKQNPRGRGRRIQSQVATVLLMVDTDGALLRASVEGLLKGVFTVDSELVKSIYWKSHPSLRPQVAALSVVSFLAPTEFRTLWSDALRASEAGEQRGALAESLAAFLNRNPSESSHYARHIREFCRERNQVARRTGILLLSVLDDVKGGDLDLVMRSLAGRASDARLAALGAIQRWAISGRRAPAAALEFIRDEEVTGHVARARKDPDELIREAATNCARLLNSQAPAASKPGARRGRGRHA